jgi:hypothetical protein
MLRASGTAREFVSLYMVNKINMDFYGDKYYCICISYYICYINRIKYKYKAASELTFVGADTTTVRRLK